MTAQDIHPPGKLWQPGKQRGRAKESKGKQRGILCMTSGPKDPDTKKRPAIPSPSLQAHRLF